MQFIDTHLHLQDYKTGFATDIVKEALIGGVDRLVCAATGMFDWDKVARFAKQYPGTVVPAFGLHPWYLQEAKPDWLPRLREYLARFPEALIGECGLDGVKNPDDEPQNSVFCQHILLAEELKRPLIIHAVRAQEWLENYWDMLPAKFVFHSYNGKHEVLKKFLKPEDMFLFRRQFCAMRIKKNWSIWFRRTNFCWKPTVPIRGLTKMPK